MGKETEETMNNPFIPQDSKLHALTRAEEENCYKDMKAKALEYCQLPIKGTKRKKEREREATIDTLFFFRLCFL